MTDAGGMRQVSDLAARSEVADAIDSYGLSEADEIARLLGLPLEQVERVLLELDSEMPLDELDDEM